MQAISSNITGKQLLAIKSIRIHIFVQRTVNTITLDERICLEMRMRIRL